MQAAFREEAIPLILYNQENQQYDINEEATEIIKNIPAPIGVITVAGLYRTGKSYLLNRMLLNRSSGFGVGPTVNACTKGLWVWGTPIKGQTQEGEMLNLLIIDSEGIGSLNEDSTHDTRVFSLAILLGSCFIYNSVGSIDENAIQNLSLVVNLTKHIHLKSGSEEVDSEDYSPYFPQFFWVIRDFSLQLVDQEGEPITSKEYLERSLVPQKGFSDEVEQKNRIRRLLTSFFKERECITLVRPVVNEEGLQKLDKTELDNLRPEFFEQVMTLRKRILTRCKPKKLNGQDLTGEMFICMARSYLTAINEGAVPNIQNAWSYLCKHECHKAEQMAYDYYEKQVKDNVYGRIPCSTEELKSINKHLKLEALIIFKKKAVGEVTQEYIDTLKKSMKHKFQVLMQQNEKESYNQCNAFIQREFNPIERKLKMNEYEDFSNYEKDLQLFHKFLIDHGPKGHNRMVIFSDFIAQALTEGSYFFLNKICNDFETSQQFANEQIMRQEQEIKEAKDDFGKEKLQIMKKVQELEKQKIDLQGNLSKHSDIISELNSQKKQIEQELSLTLQKEKGELQFLIQQQKNKYTDLEEALSTSERDRLMQMSNFNKEKAILEQRAQILERQLKDFTKKEKSLELQFNSIKQDLQSQMKEINQNDQKQIKELSQQLQELRDKSTEQNEKNEDKIRFMEAQNEQLQKNKEKLTNNLLEAQQSITNLKKEIMNLKIQEKNSQQIVKSEMTEKLSFLESQNDVLTQKLRQSQESQKQTFQDQKKNEAIMEQKVSFLQSQYDEVKQQLIDVRRQHDSTLDAFQMNTQDQLNRQENKQLISMKEQHMQELKMLEIEYQRKIQEFQNQIDAFTKEKGEQDLQFRMKEANMVNSIEEFKDQIQGLLTERQQLQTEVKELEESTKIGAKELEIKYAAQLQEMEEIQQDMAERFSREQRESQNKSEESLTQLRSYYEMEKERIETRLIEEREKSQKNYNQLIEDYEERAREEQAQYDDEIDTLKDEINQLEMQCSNQTAQYDHDMELNQKTIENLEKMLQDFKDQLISVQQNHKSQIDQQNQLLAAEKKQINDKLDQVSLDLQKKDKDYATTLQKKEQLENTLQRKEDQWAQNRNEIINERNYATDKYEEIKKQFQELQNEILENKINYEKSIALSTQQNNFFSKKVEELERQLEQSSCKYEERIKSSKMEWIAELNEKLTKNQEDKYNLEVKYDNLKKILKQSSHSNSTVITQLEKEKAVALEKIFNLENKSKENDDKYSMEIQALNKTIEIQKEQLQTQKSLLDTDIEQLRKTISQIDNEKHEIMSSYERDKALWEGKQQFLEQQRDQAKSDLQENQRKFEQTLQQLNSKRQNDKSEQEQNVHERLISLDKKYQQQIKELTDLHTQKLNEKSQKVKQLERELMNHNEKQQFDSQSKNSSQLYTEKRLNELVEGEKKLLAEIEKLKSERETKMIEYQKAHDKVKDHSRQKLNDIEEKLRETEKKRSNLIFEHEKERSKWSLEKDHLLQQKNDLQDNLNKIEKKLELLTRENERLKSDYRGGKARPSFGVGSGGNVGSSFQLLNMSRNQSSDRKSPISNRTSSQHNLNFFGKNQNQMNDFLYKNQDLSLMNSSQNQNNSGQRDSTDDIDKGNKFSILQELKDETSSNQGTGFKSFFQQKSQSSIGIEKTPEKTTPSSSLFEKGNDSKM